MPNLSIYHAAAEAAAGAAFQDSSWATVPALALAGFSQPPPDVEAAGLVQVSPPEGSPAALAAPAAPKPPKPPLPDSAGAWGQRLRV